MHQIPASIARNVRIHRVEQGFSPAFKALTLRL
jgi:hypothetical protein